MLTSVAVIETDVPEYFWSWEWVSSDDLIQRIVKRRQTNYFVNLIDCIFGKKLTDWHEDLFVSVQEHVIMKDWMVSFVEEHNCNLRRCITLHHWCGDLNNNYKLTQIVIRWENIKSMLWIEVYIKKCWVDYFGNFSQMKTDLEFD